MISSRVAPLTQESLAPQDRYVFKPFPGSSHYWALNLLDALPRHLSILDVGSGSGAIGDAAKSRGFKELYAVEIDPRARAHVRDIYCSVEESLDAYEGKKFDIILALDVIEHMAEPEKFLAKAAEFLKPGGQLLISVPNIAHWSVRLLLLFGEFEYAKRGLLDRTHLQFFTRKRVRAIPQHVPSLSLYSLSESIVPLEFLVPEWVSRSFPFAAFRSLRRWGASIFPGFGAYQILAQFRKQE